MVFFSGWVGSNTNLVGLQGCNKLGSGSSSSWLAKTASKGRIFRSKRLEFHQQRRFWRRQKWPKSDAGDCYPPTFGTLGSSFHGVLGMIF